MIARVFGVMAASMRVASILAVFSSTSTNTGFAPRSTIISAVAQTGRLGAVFRGAHRADVHVEVAKAQDFQRHLVPARRAGRRGVERAFGAFGHELARNARDVEGPGRRAELVVHDAQRRALLRL